MAHEPICTLILAGGYGTRLGELGRTTAKPLLRVEGKAILDHILESINGIECPNETYILINSKFAAQYEHWLTHKTESHPVKLINNEDPHTDRAPDIITNIAMTIEQLGHHSDLLIVGGDNLFDFPLWDFVVFSRAQHSVSTVVVDVKTQEEARRFSVVSLNEKNRITSLSEKPSCPASSIVTTCIYWFPKGRLHYFMQYSKENAHSQSFGQFVQWISTKEQLFGYQCRGNWYDVGTKEVYEVLSGQTR